MDQQRQLFRVMIDRTGVIRRADQTVQCKVLDLTEKGFRLQLETAFQVEVGGELDLEFSLCESGPLLCSIKVTHIQPPFLGVVIVRISPDHQAQLTSFIDQVNALNMTGL
jgi:hypothetical protein